MASDEYGLDHMLGAKSLSPHTWWNCNRTPWTIAHLRIDYAMADPTESSRLSFSPDVADHFNIVHGRSIVYSVHRPARMAKS